jgi:probable rRNA maturation factor
MVTLVVDAGIALPAPVRQRLRTQATRMVVAASRHDELRGEYEVSLRLCSDADIRTLNKAWRGKDKVTDVLAFAQRDAETKPWFGADNVHLGDIVISVAQARRQARRGLPAELLHLASHGLCHLLGYDHDDDAEERTMNARAAALRREAGRSGKIKAA